MTLKHHPTPHPNGFALVVTLSLMILLTIVAVGLLTLSSVSLRASSQGQAMAAAQANARMALALAIGELQKSAGPDQRITAAADILPASAPAATGRARWTGVWDTRNYNPSTPDTKNLVRWLASSPDPSTPGDPTANPGPDDVLIFKGKDALSSVKVPKVVINGDQSYAYWVEDEGIKADLGWNEGKATNPGRKQAARLSAAPGPDYGSLDGPFTSKVDYPLQTGTGNSWLGNIDKALSPADMPLVMGDSSSQSAWLRDHRHDITLGSRGVMADVKLGGLRRDLSLAFEMDGNADVSASSFPALFGKQEGEFVGGTDRLAAPRAASGMRGVRERFLYRDTKSSGSLYSTGIANGYVNPFYASVRGPNWWALRDYANLYKRLSGSSGNYTMAARANYPNRSSKTIDPAAPNSPALWDITRSENNGFGAGTGGSAWNTEVNKLSTYIFRPATANYAPVMLGTVCYFSLKNPGGKLLLIADPTFLIWNPHNRAITATGFTINMGIGLACSMKFVQTKADGTNIQYGPNDFSDFVGQASGFASDLIYNYSGLSMEPGEVLALSPKPGDTSTNCTLQLGSQPTETTGLVIRKFPTVILNAAGEAVLGSNGKPTVSWSEVTVNPGDQIKAFFALDGQGGTVDGSFMHIYSSRMNTYLTSSSGESVQGINFWANGVNDTPYDININSAGVTLDSADLGSKATGAFASIAYLALPAGSTAPVEIFSQFNPAPVGCTEGAFNRRVDPNFTFRARCIPGGLNTIIDAMGLAFPLSVRNAYWGQSYLDSGMTHVPMTNIPSSPLISLAQFSHASLTTKTSEAYHAAGDSRSSVMVSPVSPYTILPDVRSTSGSYTTEGLTAADSSWLLNDALFDRYYLSGMAPDYSISGSGYSASGTINKTLNDFFGADYRSALANPVLRPYLPPSRMVDDVKKDLDDKTDGKGYLKMGAYSLIDGQFNVNSTSVSAWAALLRSNRSLSVTYAQTGAKDNSANETPFPSSTEPTDKNLTAANYWAGFSRLDDSQITRLAGEIVNQVKLRGPFMSLSDFVNHRLGSPINPATQYAGALQSAIDASGVNQNAENGAGGISPNYSSGSFAPYFPNPPPVNNRKTTTGIAGGITQANLLLPLSPRLSARSDTFRIRGYGDLENRSGVAARAVCEAVVQRVPEYLDPNTDPTNNEPWDEAFPNPLSYTAAATGTSQLNVINTRFGRRFRIVSFRWLTPAEFN